MRIQIMGKQILNRKSNKKKKQLQKVLGKIDLVSSLLVPEEEEMSFAQVENAEYNETSSLSSYIAEFETFADEVKDTSCIPEVDFRGRVHREESSYVTEGKTEDSSIECSSQLSIRSEKQVSFIKTLLSSRTPYDEFHHLFKNVPSDQFPINDFSCALSREILLQGRLYISQGWFCFYSNIFGWETQVTIDCSKISSITREKTAYVVPNAILITTNEEKHFLSSFLSRETVYKLLIQVWEDSLAKSQSAISNSVGNAVDRETSEESLLENLPFHDVVEDEENDNADLQESSKCGYDIESKFSADSGFFDCQATGVLVAELDTDKQKLMAFDKSLQEEIHHSSSKLPTCASMAVCVASVAEMLYSYFQVGLRLVRRLSKEQLFILVATMMIICLMCCSAFLLYRLSVLEPKVFAPHTPRKTYIHQSVKQILKLRKEVYDAEVLRVRKIVSANLDVISQIQDTLKMLQDDLANQLQRNCTLIHNNMCVRL